MMKGAARSRAAGSVEGIDRKIRELENEIKILRDKRKKIK
jgi:hypothetical protein